MRTVFNQKLSCLLKGGLAFLIFLCFILNAYPQNANKFLTDEFKKPMQVKVSVNESQISSLVKSYIKRELRSLGDVIIVESDPFFEIEIIADVVQNKGGDVVGVALSTVFLQPYDLKGFKDAIVLTLQRKNMISNAGIQEIEREFDLWEKAGMNILNELEGHMLYIGSDEDLKKLCEDIVAKFDNDCLEFPRQLRQKLKRQFNIQ